MCMQFAFNAMDNTRLLGPWNDDAFSVYINWPHFTQISHSYYAVSMILCLSEQIMEVVLVCTICFSS